MHSGHLFLFLTTDADEYVGIAVEKETSHPEEHTMPPPPPPSKSYLLVLDSDSSEDSEDEHHHHQQRPEYQPRQNETVNAAAPQEVLGLGKFFNSRLFSAPPSISKPPAPSNECGNLSPNTGNDQSLSNHSNKKLSKSHNKVVEVI